MGKKKLSKDLSTHPLIKITVADGERGEMIFDFSKLPEDIQTKLGPFGLGHKLGDSAAGKAGTDAEDAITKTWDGLMEGNWSVRVPAAPKVSLKEVAANLANLSDKEKKTAQAVLASLGIKIPGVNA
ncbi:MAG: hypothetical protein WCY49_07105 [Anaerovoracaceae bacterium]